MRRMAALYFLPTTTKPVAWVRSIGPHCQWTTINAAAPAAGSPDAAVLQVMANHQSPTHKCDTDMSAYTFTAGTCTWDQLEFFLEPNSVKLRVSENADCTMGSMMIPHMPNRTFNAVQFHIHTSSEHTIAGATYPAEMHIVHQEDNSDDFYANSLAVFGMMIAGGGSSDHAAFEDYLRGWEKVALSVDQACSEAAAGDAAADAQDAMESSSSSSGEQWWMAVQTKVTCPAIGSNTYTEQDFDDTVSPNVYALPTDPDFGVYTYKGGLTTPPCTEIVNWNVMDTPMIISDDQLNRLYNLILCYVDPQTCWHATVASKDGSTSRPTQPLNGRHILHRCRTCEGCPTLMVDVGAGRVAAAAAVGRNGSFLLFMFVTSAFLMMMSVFLWTWYDQRKKKEHERVNSLLLSPSEHKANAYHDVASLPVSPLT